MPELLPPHFARKTAGIATLGLAFFALSACEVRQDGEASEPEPDATPTATAATPSPTPSESASPAASILRDGSAEPEEAELPPEPVELTIPFPDGANLSLAAERQLARILTTDAMDQDWPVVLAGHTDSSGNDQANLRASRARAEAVAAWLVEHGIDDDRIVVIGFGEQNPVQPNALPDGSPNEEGRRANRRVELRIAPPASGATNEDGGESATRR